MPPISSNAQAAAMQAVQTGTTGTQADIIDRELWDEEIFAAALLQNRLFMVPLSQGGKLLDNTNNQQAGVMPANRKLFVYAIGVDYVSETTGGIKATAADVQAFYTQLARTTVELYINNREFGTYTLQKLFGCRMLVAANPALTLNLPMIQPDFRCITPLNRYIEISGTTSFYVQITHAVAPTAATIGDRLRVGLIGVETRVN